MSTKMENAAAQRKPPGAGEDVAQRSDSKTPHEYVEDPDRFFREWIPTLLERYPEDRKKFGRARAIAQISLTGARGGTWHVVLDHGDVDVVGGAHPKPSFVIAMSADTWIRMQRGDLTGLRAWLTGKIRFKGSRLALIRVGRCFT